jgi:transmembrane sensor
MKAEDTSSRAPDAGDLARTALDWPRHSGQVDQFLEAIGIRKRRLRRRRMQLAASGGIAVMLIAGFAWHSGEPRIRRMETPPAVDAMVSFPTRQTLPDGSVVELQSGAAIATTFTDSVRRVVMRKGVAHFQVTTNLDRPFVVVAGTIEVRALGTGFAVDLTRETVEVLVTEGRVAVNEARGELGGAGQADATPVPVPLAVLNGGNRVVLQFAAQAAAPQVEVVTELELQERLSWRVPRLDFSGTPLAEAIPVINRHSGVRIVLADAELGKVELSGVLRADNIEPLLRMLQSNYGIEAERSGTTIVLRNDRLPAKPK